MAAVSVDGTRIADIGDPDEIIYLRSSAKPFQLAPFVASGHFDAYNFPEPDRMLAVMAASHAGEDRHVRLVQTALRTGGLTSAVLQCGTHTPFDSETARRLARDGEPPTELRHNCSGKHAAMTLHAKAAGWDVDTYWHPDHPIQQGALATVATLTGVPAAKVGTATDGCGVVTFAVPLRAAALAFARLADPADVSDAPLRDALTRIRDAMAAHPELVAGEHRHFDTDLMRAAPGRLVAKGGAEGLRCVGIMAGALGSKKSAAGVAMKIEDGDAARRAGAAATSHALRQIGALDDAAWEAMASYGAAQVHSGARDEVVGEVRSAFRLAL